MPPTVTPSKRQILQNKVDSGQSIFRGGVKPPEVYGTQPSTGFNVKIPDTVPSTALSGDNSIADVRAKRNQMESSQLALQQFNTDFGNLMGKVQAPLTATPFQNPEQFINETLLRRPTETAQALSDTQQQQAQGFRDIGAGLDKTRQDLTKQFALPELQANLAETNNRIAERTNQLRQTMRDFETNAERRGVAREFVQAEKQKVQADAAAELADLAIIQSAQSGNLQMAREDIDRALNQKIQAFEFENQAIQTEIKRLEGIDSKESQARSEQLQIALQERNRNIEQAVADEKARLNYLSEAAANGADQGTLLAIQKAKTPSEAALLAGPFIGRLDRQAKEASIASAYSTIATNRLNQQKLLQELNPTGDQSTNQDITAYAQQYAETGKLPSPAELKLSNISVSQVTEYAKQVPKPDGAILSSSTGIKPTSLSAEQEKGIAAINEIVNKTLPALKDRFGKINTGLIGGTLGYIYTSQDRQDYNTFRAEFLSKLLVARSGAAVTEQEYARYAELLPTNFNQMFFLGSDGMKKLNSLESSMKTNLDSTLNSTGAVIQGYSKVKVGDTERTVGEILDIGGVNYRVLPDGSLTDII